MCEEWRDISGYEGVYQVSNQGRVRSLHKQGPGKNMASESHILKNVLNNKGYYQVTLCLNKTRKGRTIHQLVAEAFLGPRPDGLTTNHKNGITTDNIPDNLEYVSMSDNMKHMHHVLRKTYRGTRHWKAKLSEHEVKTIRTLHKTGRYTAADLAVLYDIGTSNVYHILTRRNWKHI